MWFGAVPCVPLQCTILPTTAPQKPKCQHTHGIHRQKHLREFIWTFQALLLIARAFSGIPYLAGDNIAPYVTRMLLHCLHLWCYLVRCYLLHAISVKDQQSTCQACSITGPAYFFFVSPHTECYKVYLMSSFTLRFHFNGCVTYRQRW